MSVTPLTPEQAKLAEDNVALAQYLAEVAYRKMGGIAEKDEVLSAAYSGLVTAARNYDPGAHERSAESVADGTAFSSYARRRILGSVLDWQRAQDHVPRRQRKVYKELMELGYGEGEAVEDLAVKVGLPIKRVQHIISRVEGAPVSLNNYLPHTGEESSLGFQFESIDNVEGETLVSRVMQSFTDSWEDLPHFQKLIIALKYYGEAEISTIASMLDLSLAETDRLYREAVITLHEVMMSEVSESN